MKKIIAMLLALVMVIGLVACGTKNVEPTVEPTVAPTTATTEEVVETPTEEVVTEPAEVSHYVVPSADDFTWEDMGDQIAIISYNGAEQYVEIPDTINGVHVVAVRGNAFANSAVVGVKLPASLVTICDDAFRDVTTLVEIEFGEWTGLVGANAFNGCAALTTVVMNNNLAIIMEGAFANCPALVHVDLPANIMSVDPNAFDETTVAHADHNHGDVVVDVE